MIGIVDIVVHVPTKEQYDTLMSHLESQGWVWGSGALPTKENNFKDHRKETCVRLKPNRTLIYCNESWYISHGYDVISFDEYATKYINLNRKLVQSILELTLRRSQMD